jgi:hypothetical protein
MTKDAPGVSTRGKTMQNVTSSPTTLASKTKTTTTTTNTITTTMHNTPTMSTTQSATNNTIGQSPKINKLHLGNNSTKSAAPIINSDSGYDFTRFGLVAEDIDLSENDLYKVCSQIQKITYLRQAYKIMEEQMKIISQLLPKITPNSDKKIEELQDITNWITLQQAIWENTGYTKITTTELQSCNGTTKQFIHTFDTHEILEKISHTKTKTVPTGIDIQTETEEEEDTDEYTTVKHKKSKRNKVAREKIDVQPPKLHPTLNKLDDIRSQFSRNKLIEDCGDTKIDGKSEYEYFADVRKKITWFVDSWENSMLSPYDRKTQERFKKNVDTVEEIVDEASSVTQKRLIGKAFRKVKSNYRHLFFTTEKLNTPNANYQNNLPKVQPQNYQQQNQRQHTYHQNNQYQPQLHTNYQTYAQRAQNNVPNTQHQQQQATNTNVNTSGNDNSAKNLIADLLKKILEGL